MIVTTAVGAVRGPSTSVSFVNTEIVTGVSSKVVTVSLVATGASLTALTVIVKVWSTQLAGSGVPESQTVITTVSVPLKFGAGV